MEVASDNFVVGWVAILTGILSGAIIGLFFHQEEWLGGYGSYRRRMTRLGHISFFGLGFINVLFALSTTTVRVSDPYLRIASLALIVGVIAMPTCCFLTAWRRSFRHLFPLPVLAALIGIVSFLLGGLP
jgi:hypothetical protein